MQFAKLSPNFQEMDGQLGSISGPQGEVKASRGLSPKAAAAAHEEEDTDDDSDGTEEDTNPQPTPPETDNSPGPKDPKDTLDTAVMEERITLRMTAVMETMMVKLQPLKAQIRKRKAVDIFSSFEISVMISDGGVTTFAKGQKRFKISKNSTKRRDSIAVSTEKVGGGSDPGKRQGICQGTKINKFFEINNNNGNADSELNEILDTSSFFDFSNVSQSSSDEELFFVESTKLSNTFETEEFSFSSSFKLFSEEDGSFSDDVNHTSSNIVVKLLSSSFPSPEKFKKARKKT